MKVFFYLLVFFCSRAISQNEIEGTFYLCKENSVKKPLEGVLIKATYGGSLSVYN